MCSIGCNSETCRRLSLMQQVFWEVSNIKSAGLAIPQCMEPFRDLKVMVLALFCDEHGGTACIGRKECTVVPITCIQDGLLYADWHHRHLVIMESFSLWKSTVRQGAPIILKHPIMGVLTGTDLIMPKLTSWLISSFTFQWWEWVLVCRLPLVSLLEWKWWPVTFLLWFSAAGVGTCWKHWIKSDWVSSFPADSHWLQSEGDVIVVGFGWTGSSRAFTCSLTVCICWSVQFWWRGWEVRREQVKLS